MYKGVALVRVFLFSFTGTPYSIYREISASGAALQHIQQHLHPSSLLQHIQHHDALPEAYTTHL